MRLGKGLTCRIVVNFPASQVSSISKFASLNSWKVRTHSHSHVERIASLSKSLQNRGMTDVSVMSHAVHTHHSRIEREDLLRKARGFVTFDVAPPPPWLSPLPLPSLCTRRG